MEAVKITSLNRGKVYDLIASGAYRRCASGTTWACTPLTWRPTSRPTGWSRGAWRGGGAGRRRQHWRPSSVARLESTSGASPSVLRCRWSAGRVRGTRGAHMRWKPSSSEDDRPKKLSKGSSLSLYPRPLTMAFPRLQTPGPSDTGRRDWRGAHGTRWRRTRGRPRRGDLRYRQGGASAVFW